MEPLDIEPFDIEPLDIEPLDAAWASAEPAMPKLINRAKAAVLPKVFIVSLLKLSRDARRTFQLAGTGLADDFRIIGSSRRSQDGAAGTGLDQNRITKTGLRRGGQRKVR